MACITCQVKTEHGLAHTATQSDIFTCGQRTPGKTKECDLHGGKNVRPALEPKRGAWSWQLRIKCPCPLAFGSSTSGPRPRSRNAHLQGSGGRVQHVAKLRLLSKGAFIHWGHSLETMELLATCGRASDLLSYGYLTAYRTCIYKDLQDPTILWPYTGFYRSHSLTALGGRPPCLPRILIHHGALLLVRLLRLPATRVGARVRARRVGPLPHSFLVGVTMYAAGVQWELEPPGPCGVRFSTPSPTHGLETGRRTPKRQAPHLQVAIAALCEPRCQSLAASQLKCTWMACRCRPTMFY